MADPAVARRSSAAVNEGSGARLLIAGLGNPMMADDGVGHSVLRGLERCDLPPEVRLCAVDGDVLALAVLWRGEAAVWLVDAVSGSSPPGQLRVFEHEEVLGLPNDRVTTHQAGLSDCLGWLLHGRPEMASVRFRLFGIEAGIVRPGRGASPAVEGAVRSLVEVIVEATRECCRDREVEDRSRSGRPEPISS